MKWPPILEFQKDSLDVGICSNFIININIIVIRFIIRKMKIIIVLCVLALGAFSAPFDDFVDLLIPGYENHNWYSGILLIVI